MTSGLTPALTRYVQQLPSTGSFSLWFGPLVGEPALTHRAAVPHYAASTMKLALVLAAYRSAERGLLSLDASVLVHEDFVSRADGSPFRMDEEEDSDPQPWQRRGEHVALRWLCSRALVKSSNLATNLVLDEVGTEAVTEVLDLVGATGSTVSRGIEDTAAREAGLQNLVTAADLALTLRALHTERVLTQASASEVLGVLAAQQINDAIPAGLPAGTRVAHKSGWVDGISHDAAIVYPGAGDGAEPFVLVICTTSQLDEQAGLELIAAGAAAAWTDRRLGS